MNNTKNFLKLTIMFLLTIVVIFIVLEPVSYSSSLIDNARFESGSRPPIYGGGDPGGGDPGYYPDGSSGGGSGNVTIVRNWYRGISGKVYERTDNSSEIDGIETPKIGIERC